MRILVAVVALFLLAPFALGQAGGSPDAEAKVKEEIRKLFLELNEAFLERDRAALERLYADEFLWIHAFGRVDDKAKHINGSMSIESRANLPAPPALDRLLVYGDVAVLRSPARNGVLSTSIFTKKDGRWRFTHAQGTQESPERNPVRLDPKALNVYVGKYRYASGSDVTVTREGDFLKYKRLNSPASTLAPLSDDRFFFTEDAAEMTFHKNGEGRITHLVLRLGSCRESEAKKVE